MATKGTLASICAALAVVGAVLGTTAINERAEAASTMLPPIPAGPRTTLDAASAAVIGDAAASLFSACTHSSVAVVAQPNASGGNSVVGAAVVYANAWGSKASFKTRREWGSVSKVATALATIRLVEHGELSLARPIWEVGPLTAALVPPARRKDPITLEHLLTHRAGLTHEKYRGTPQMFYRTPGKKYHYSSNGYGVIGVALSERTGLSFSEVLQQQIAVPAASPSTSVKKDSFAAPSALVRSNILDFGAFAAAVLDGKIVSRTLLADMTVPRVVFTDGDTVAEGVQRWWKGAPTGYGLGFEVRGVREARVAGHTGKNGNKRAFLAFRLARGQAVAAFCDARRGKDPDWWRLADAVFAAPRLHGRP